MGKNVSTKRGIYAIAMCFALCWVAVSAQDVEVSYLSSTKWTDGYDLVVKSDYVYSGMSNGLQVLDISDPSDPVLVRNLYLGTVSTSVCVRGSHLFVGTSVGDIHVYSISNPADPSPIATLPVGGWIGDLAVVQNTLYVAVRASMIIADLSDITNPEVVGIVEIPTLSHARQRGLSVTGQTVFLGAGDIYVIDVSDVQGPFIVEEYDPGPGWQVYDLEVSNDAVMAIAVPSYIPPYKSLLLRLRNQEQEGLTEVLRYEIYRGANRIECRGDTAFIVCDTAGLKLIDLSNPDSLILVSEYPGHGWPYGLDVAGDMIVIGNNRPLREFRDLESLRGPPNNAPTADQERTISQLTPQIGDLLILTLSDDINPQLTGIFPHPGFSDNISISSEYVLITEEDGTVSIVQMDDSGGLEHLSMFACPGWPKDVDQFNDFLFIAAGNAGVQIADISDPTEPSIIGSIAFPGSAEAIRIRGGLAFIVGASGLGIYGISDPYDPVCVGGVETPDWAFDIILSGSHAFVADRYSGMQVVDISDPANPSIVASYPEEGSPAWAIRLSLTGNVLAIAGGSIIELVDVEDPAQPQLLGTHSPGSVRDVAVDSGLLFIARNPGGLQVVNISDPSTPGVLGNYPIPTYPLSVQLVGTNRLLIANHSALLVFDFTTPGGGGSGTGWLNDLRAYPNPFNSNVTITFELSNSANMDIEVFNVLGQSVRALANGRRDAGTNSIVWHGLNQSGRLVGSGMYFCRLKANGMASTQKLVLIR